MLDTRYWILDTGYLLLDEKRETRNENRELSHIWFDTPAEPTKKEAVGLVELVREKQPRCLVNSRVGNNHGDYNQMGDNQLMASVYSKEYWEVPATINETWGYKSFDLKKD